MQKIQANIWLRVLALALPSACSHDPNCVLADILLSVKPLLKCHVLSGDPQLSPQFLPDLIPFPTFVPPENESPSHICVIYSFLIYTVLCLLFVSRAPAHTDWI